MVAAPTFPVSPRVLADLIVGFREAVIEDDADAQAETLLGLVDAFARTAAAAAVRASCPVCSGHPSPVLN